MYSHQNILSPHYTMTSFIDYFTEGPRIIFSSWKQRLFPKKYPGNAQEICQQIVADCWNGHFFQTSTGHFRQFWTRDIGWCTQALMKLGYQQEVQQTLRYALNRFQEAKKVTTTITPGGRCFDFPVAAVDSLPWLIHSIAVSKSSYHHAKHFLASQVKHYVEQFINPQTGLVKPNLHTSSIKDFAKRQSSCYDNCMMGMLSHDLARLKLDNPLQKYNYPALIKQHFWNGTYFFDDLSRQNYVAGDAQLFPFLTGMCKDKEMLESCIRSVQLAGLDNPLPLKYTATRKNIHFIFLEPLMYNYEGTSIWLHMGPLWIKLVQQVDAQLASQYQEKYRDLIERLGNYPEVLTPAGKLFTTPIYVTDRGLLWAANYLTL